MEYIDFENNKDEYNINTLNNNDNNNNNFNKDDFILKDDIINNETNSKNENISNNLGLEKINKYLFEISWEVCNKVGGIYTVITSKIKEVQKIFGDNYYLIGPYLNNNSENPEFKEFEEHEISHNFKIISKKLEEKGIKLHFGEWFIEGRPKAILIEYNNYSKNMNYIKGKIWEFYKIDSLNSNWYDWDEPILWSWTAGIFIEEFNNLLNNGIKEDFELNSNENKVDIQNIIVQSHEWMSGGAILYLNSLKNKNDFRTIFTTHATMLGRSICGNGENLYSLINSNIDVEKKAYEIGVHTKHQTERVLANISNSFTTVSNITSREAEFFYKKKADVILYNGFDNSEIGGIDYLNSIYLNSRERTNIFLKSYFNDFYDIDTEKTQIFYTSGRFELKNKGIDLLLNSAKKLNEKLIKENSEKNFVIFLLVMMGNFNMNDSISKSINNYKHGIRREFDIDFAPISTHEVPTNNELIKKIIENNLLNNKEDRVKIILIPEILNGSKNVFNFKYYDLISGFDLGIFPSFYEPWGYTPLESISYAVPTITSDLSGFGEYIKNNFKIDFDNENYKNENNENNDDRDKKNKENNPVKILERKNKTFEESSDLLFDYFLEFMNENQKNLYLQRLNSKNFALNFDWSKFIENYKKAYGF